MDITSQSIVTAIQPATTSFINNFITPKLAEWRDASKLNKELDKYLNGDKFEEYSERAEEKYSYITTIVFGNQRKRIQDLYVPLTLSTINNDSFFDDYIHLEISNYNDEFLPKYKKILLKSTAGMGKSTVMKMLFLYCMEKGKSFPVFLELKKLKGDKSIFDVICEELSGLNEEPFKKLIQLLITRGEFTFFFDGYDEISFDSKTKVTELLEDFISKASNNLFIISSRPETLSFPNFHEFQIKPLYKSQAYELMKKYDTSGNIYKPLVEEIEKVYGDTINDFLENPLVVTLLYMSFVHKQRLHSKRISFYEQIFNALFEDHDLTKGGGFIHQKHSKLDKEEFHKVLRALGFISSTKGDWYNHVEIMDILRKVREVSKVDFKPDNLLKDLYSVVPLFVKEGTSYGWSHKSLQDYFACQYLNVDSKQHQKDYLLKIFRKGERYFNVLSLYYEAEKDTFRKVIGLELANEFISFYENKYKDIDTEFISKEDINLRKLLTFGKDVYITKIKKPEGYDQIREYDNIEDGLIREPDEYAIGVIYENTDYTYYVRWKQDHLQNGTKLISTIKDPVLNNLFQDNNLTFNLLYKDILESEKFIEEGKNYHVNDNTSFLNTVEWFNLTNHILMRTFSSKFRADKNIPFYFQSYSISECLSFRDKIKKEMENDLNNSLIDI